VGEREGAARLGPSRSGLKGAIARSKGPKTKDRRGQVRKLIKKDVYRIRRLRESEKKRGGNPTRKFVRRRLGLWHLSERQIGRVITGQGDKYQKRPGNSLLTEAKKKDRVKWAKARLDFDWSGVDFWCDCHAVSMPLVHAPLRSHSTYFKVRRLFSQVQ